MRSGWVAVTLLVVTLAGCVDAERTSDEPSAAMAVAADWWRGPLASAEDHDHADRTLHANLTTPNFEIIGHDPLISDHYGHTPAGYLCGDAVETQDGRRLAAVESRSDVGFAIADVTDPTAPRWLGELVMEYTYVYDLAVVPDGRHVVLVTANAKNLPDPLATTAPRLAGASPSGLWWHTPCQTNGPVPVTVVPRVAATVAPAATLADAEDPVPRPASLLLVDISDPTRPTIVDQRPLTGYGHSAFSTIIDGRTWVLASTVGNPNVQNFQFYEIVTTAAGAVLNHLHTFSTPPGPGIDQGAIGGHTDGWIAVHPITGQTLAYLVGGRHFITLDLENPYAPEALGSWTDRVPGRTGPTGNLHSVFPLRDEWNGDHYTVIGPEYGDHPEGQPSGNIWVLDTTDPARVREVAAWTLPGDANWTGTYMFSNHYLTVHNATIFVSMYHGGVWALDMSQVTRDSFHLLPSVGVFVPVETSPRPSERTVRWTPTLEEVLSFPDGTLVTFDSMSGLYTFRFDPSEPAPAPTPWPVEPVTPR